MLAQTDKSWLWYRWLCHINFDNIMKISTAQVVRDLPKPANPICKECQFGKQTRTSFKRKDKSIDGVLELVHKDLCGPTRIRSLQGDTYFMFLIDDYSKMTWVTILNIKLKI